MQMFETQQGEGCFCYFEAKKNPHGKRHIQQNWIVLDIIVLCEVPQSNGKNVGAAKIVIRGKGDQ